MELIYDTVREGSLFSFFLACAVLDFRRRKVPNWLSGSGGSGAPSALRAGMVPGGSGRGAAAAPPCGGRKRRADGRALPGSLLSPGRPGNGRYQVRGHGGAFYGNGEASGNLCSGDFSWRESVFCWPRAESRERKLPMIPFFLGGFLLERLT